MPNTDACYTSFLKLMPKIKHQPGKRQLQTLLRFKWSTTPFSLFPQRTGLVIHVLSQPALSPRHFLGPVTPSPGATPLPLHPRLFITFGIGQQNLITESFPSITQLNIEPESRAQTHSLCLSPLGSPGDGKDSWQPTIVFNTLTQRINSPCTEGLGKASPLGTHRSLGGECKIPAKGQILSKLSPIYLKMCQCTAARRMGSWGVGSSIPNQTFPNLNQKEFSPLGGSDSENSQGLNPFSHLNWM